MSELVFGDVPGYPPGSTFENRKVLSRAGVHRPIQAGIAGRAVEGADSIVLSGGYEDDEDLGDEIVYTGHGGRDLNTGVQIADQTLKRGNAALAQNRVTGLPVRVIRGANHNSSLSPRYGYRYDGLYRVEDVWQERGRSGFLVWRYRLVKAERLTVGLEYAPASTSLAATEQVKTSISRIVSDTALSRHVKKLYDYQCQVCGIRLDGPVGPYAEAAHIQPLGSPHNGPDVVENIICLCPNHHVLFDIGAFVFADDLRLIGLSGRLQKVSSHEIGLRYLAYRRSHYWDDTTN